MGRSNPGWPDEFPAEVARADRASLVDAVRLRLRQRMDRLIVRAIAERLRTLSEKAIRKESIDA